MHMNWGGVHRRAGVLGCRPKGGGYLQGMHINRGVHLRGYSFGGFLRGLLSRGYLWHSLGTGRRRKKFHVPQISNFGERNVFAKQKLDHFMTV